MRMVELIVRFVSLSLKNLYRHLVGIFSVKDVHSKFMQRHEIVSNVADQQTERLNRRRYNKNLFRKMSQMSSRQSKWRLIGTSTQARPVGIYLDKTILVI